jgi:hypothetical protein
MAWAPPAGTTLHEDQRGRKPDAIKIAECEKAKRDGGATLAEHLDDEDLRILKSSWYQFLRKQEPALKLATYDEPRGKDGVVLHTLAIVKR